MIRATLPLSVPPDIEARDYDRNTPLDVVLNSYPVEVWCEFGTVIGVAHGATLTRFLTLPDGSTEALES